MPRKRSHSPSHRSHWANDPESTMNFSDLYVSYATEQTDAPEIYHKVLAYFIVSSIVAKNIYFQFGYKKLYPNLYILLGAPSSLHRKSWSQDMALSLIAQINPGLEVPELSSREAFIAELAAEERTPQGVGIIALDELSGFLKRMRRSAHFEGFLQDLCSCYDAKRIFRRAGVDAEKKVVTILDDPFLNLTAACSLDWLDEAAQTSDITGGFLSRFLWVVVDTKINHPKPEPGHADPAKREQLIEKLQTIKNYLGSADFTTEGRTAWGKWYSEFRTTHQGGQWDANYERLTVIARKLALLQAVMRLEAAGEPLQAGAAVNVGPNDIWPAVSLVEDSTLSFANVTVGANKMDVLAKKVLRLINKNNQITRSDLLRNVAGLDAWSLNAVTQTLVQSDNITVNTMESNGKKPVTVYSKSIS